jgi:hypothetical protein
MAHQAHNIPWNLLASNLHWRTTSRRAHSVTNLCPRMKQDQGKELTYFIEAFIRNINDHSLCERRKYPSVYEAVDSTEVILDSATVQKIALTVRKWRSYGFGPRCPSGICQVAQEECQCVPIPNEERMASAFLRPPGPRYGYQFFDWNREGFFNVEVVKTLLLHGEMDTILRVCALPGVSLREWWSNSECMCAVGPSPVESHFSRRHDVSLGSSTITSCTN